MTALATAAHQDEVRTERLEPPPAKSQPLPRPPWWRLHSLSWLVFALLVLASVGSSVVAGETVRDQQQRQLQARAEQAASVLSVTVYTLDSGISALLPASVGLTDHTVFDRMAVPMVTPVQGRSAYRAVAAVQQTPTGAVVTTAAGTIKEGATLTTGPRADALRAAWKQPGVLQTTPIFIENGTKLMGFAKAAPVGGAVYVEVPVRVYSPASEQGPFSDVEGAMYRTRTQQVDQAILATTLHLPVKGTTASADIPVGDQQWLLVVKARQSLVGGAAEALPWILLGLGLVTAVLATMFVEVIARRRDYGWALVAERTSELRAANEQLEARVAERTARLNASNQELEAFAYSVSHDLRAPLRAMDGYSKALLEDYSDKVDDDGKRYLQRVRAGAQSMGRLIDDVLSLSRVVRAEIRPRLVDLGGTARSVISEYEEQDPHRQVDVRIADGLVVPGDPTLLRALMENLLANAWKFTATHETARIEVGELERDGERVFFVRDDGVGFDMAYAKNLFKAFERLHRAEQFPGTGVGLATVERIVRRHGGRVWAQAEVEKGATFYFTLAAPPSEA